MQFKPLEELKRTVAEITRTVLSHRNGAIVASLKEKGFNYKVNLGVPYSELKTIAVKYEPNAGLSQLLWEKGWREMRILSFMLSEPDALTFAQVEERIEHSANTELLDQLALHILTKRSGVKTEIVRLINGRERVHFYAALATIPRTCLKHCKEDEADYFTDLLIENKLKCNQEMDYIIAFGKALARTCLKGSRVLDDVYANLSEAASEGKKWGAAIDLIKTEALYR